MKRLFTNSVFSVDYIPQQQLLIERWYGQITEENYKESMLALLKIFIQYQNIRRVIVHPNLHFIIGDELQEWTITNVFVPISSTYLEKIAFIIPEQINDEIFMGYLTLEQILDDVDWIFKYKFFNDVQQAEIWLFSE